jgi:tripartite-type tricarboxylate transporter receptor subunit TctC
MGKWTRWACAFVVALGAISCGPRGSWAAGYPDKPVNIIVPYVPGGATDLIARVAADQLSKKFGQNFLVINKPGAFGVVALQEVLRQPADGYTIMIGNISTNAITPVIFAKSMKFDFDTAFITVMKLAEAPNVLVATTVDFPPNTVAELVAYAKAHPDKVRYASAGIGSHPHFLTEMLDHDAGIKMVHVPIKGGAGDMLNSLATGDTQVGVLNVATAEGMVKAKRLKVLAAMAQGHLPHYPGAPTMVEAGYPGLNDAQWFSLLVRTGTPPAIVDTLFKAMTEVMTSDQSRKAFDTAGFYATLSKSPAEAQAWQKDEERRWRDIEDVTKITLN